MLNDNNIYNERMMNMKIKNALYVILGFVLFFPSFVSAKETIDRYELPNYVISISKENTYPNETEDEAVVEPSQDTVDLLESTDVPIENTDLIQLLNETTIKPTIISFGYRGSIYLGRWPLYYESSDTTVNWEYHKINEHELNNAGNNNDQTVYYEQQKEEEIIGALTSKVPNSENVRKMILLKAKDKTKLPLSFRTVIGKGTKTNQPYKIPPKKHGVLSVYAPAVNEKGQITFGEVYIELKGTKKQLTIKNVTKQGIGAWIPVQDHATISFIVR